MNIKALLLLLLLQANFYTAHSGTICFPSSDEVMVDDEKRDPGQELVERFTPDVHMHKQTDADLALIEKMRPLFFEQDDADVKTKQLNVYKKALTYGAQEIVLMTEDNVRVSAHWYKRENAPLTIMYVTGYFPGGLAPGKEWCAPFAAIFPEYNILAFDWRGVGHSEGLNRLFRKNSFGSRAHLDIQAGIDFIKKNTDVPVMLHGFCFGGAMALHATLEAKKHNKPTADALGFSCVLDRFEHLYARGTIAEDRWHYKLLFKFFLESGLGEAMLDYMMNGSLFDINPIDMITQLDPTMPCYFDHFTHDQFSLLSGGINVYNAARGPKIFVQADLGRHARSHIKTPAQYRDAYIGFLQTVGLLKN